MISCDESPVLILVLVCFQEYPGVYARMSGLKDYIDGKVCDLSKFPPTECGGTSAPVGEPSLAPTSSPVSAPTSPPVPRPTRPPVPPPTASPVPPQPIAAEQTKHPTGNYHKGKGSSMHTGKGKGKGKKGTGKGKSTGKGKGAKHDKGKGEPKGKGAKQGKGKGVTKGKGVEPDKANGAIPKEVKKVPKIRAPEKGKGALAEKDKGTRKKGDSVLDEVDDDYFGFAKKVSWLVCAAAVKFPIVSFLTNEFSQ